MPRFLPWMRLRSYEPSIDSFFNRQTQSAVVCFPPPPFLLLLPFPLPLLFASSSTSQLHRCQQHAFVKILDEKAVQLLKININIFYSYIFQKIIYRLSLYFFCLISLPKKNRSFVFSILIHFVDPRVFVAAAWLCSPLVQSSIFQTRIFETSTTRRTYVSLVGLFCINEDQARVMQSQQRQIRVFFYRQKKATGNHYICDKFRRLFGHYQSVSNKLTICL